MLRSSLLKVESPQSRVFFAIFFLPFCKKGVLEPELENRYILISMYRPSFSLSNYSGTCKGTLKEGLLKTCMKTLHKKEEGNIRIINNSVH